MTNIERAIADVDAAFQRTLAQPPIGYALLAWWQMPWWKRIFTPMPTEPTK